MRDSGKPKLAVYKLTSCSGCQLSFLNMETELTALAEAVEIARFALASDLIAPGPYDIAFVEGSVSCPRDLVQLQQARASSKVLVAIGNCAVHGGPQALRNWLPLTAVKEAVYPAPEAVDCFPDSQGIGEYVPVDGFLPGCPVNPDHLRAYVTGFLLGKAPEAGTRSVCLECKMKANVCLIVAEGVACMGVVTAAGCGAICPSYDRGCYGCFGPSADPNLKAFSNLCRELGLTPDEIHRKFRFVTCNAKAFREEATKYETRPAPGGVPEPRGG